ncbi:MAG: hypothetical protein PVG35_06960 [Desulfobacterales bacterium]
MITNFIKDRGGTRSGVERRKRQFIYLQKDRRSGRDRRAGNDRRQGICRYQFVDRLDAIKGCAADRSSHLGTKDN